MRVAVCVRVGLVIGVSVAVGMVTSCGTQPSRAAVTTPPSASPTQAAPRAADWPVVRDDVFAQPWNLDDGAFRVDPTEAATPGHSRSAAVQAMRTAQREFYLRSLGMRSSGDNEDLGAAYGLVTLGPHVRIEADESGKPAAVMPGAADYQRRPAWVVWFRVTGGTSSCPAQLAGTTQSPVPEKIREHAGWHVFVYPDRLDAAITYFETRPAACGGVTGGTATVASQHIGVPWRLVQRPDSKATFVYTPPPCARFVQAGGSGGPEWETTIVVAAPFGSPPCPSPTEQTITLDVPGHAHVTAGPTGILTGA